MGNNLTGYPSVDKPQMAFYRTDEKKNNLIKKYEKKEDD